MSINTEIRDGQIVKLITEGVKPSKAMVMVGYSENTVNKCSGRIISRIRERLCEEFHKKGVDSSYLTAKLVNGVENSTKPIVLDGNIVDYPDHSTRLSYLKEILKIADAYPTDKLELSAETYEERIMRLHSQAQAPPDGQDTPDTLSE